MTMLEIVDLLHKLKQLDNNGTLNFLLSFQMIFTTNVLSCFPCMSLKEFIYVHVVTLYISYF